MRQFDSYSTLSVKHYAVIFEMKIQVIECRLATMTRQLVFIDWRDMQEKNMVQCQQGRMVPLYKLRL